MYSSDSDLDLLVADIPVGQGDAGVMEELDLSIPDASHGEYICLRRATAKRLFFMPVGVAVVGSTGTIVFKKRVTPRSAVGEVVIGTLNVPAGLSIGQVLYKNITPVNINAGESIEISHTQTTAGQGHVRIDMEPHTESFANSSNMVEDQS